MPELLADDLWGDPRSQAAVWRRSYSRMAGNPADFSNGLKWHCTKRDSRVGHRAWHGTHKVVSRDSLVRQEMPSQQGHDPRLELDYAAAL